MNDFLEILKYILPSLVVLSAAYMLVRLFLVNDYRRWMHELKLNDQKIATPIRLQAYERLVMLLERISPNNLILRVHRPGMNAQQLQLQLIAAIREEFDYNLSQQVYISGKTWELIKKAKEEGIKLVNTCAGKISDEASGADLSQVIIQIYAETNARFITDALESLKKEVRQMF